VIVAVGIAQILLLLPSSHKKGRLGVFQAEPKREDRRLGSNSILPQRSQELLTPHDHLDQ
jgi:hypothetical protein